MSSSVVGLIIVIALILLFAWLARRAWRSPRAAIKWPGTIVAGLLALALAVVGGAALNGVMKLNTAHANPVPEVALAGTPEQIARGERLSNTCAGCHSTSGTLPLDGSAEGFLGPLGTLYAPNLTPAGSIADWSDGEVIRAIREGIGKDGRTLLLMPSASFHHMSDEDVQAIVAYLRSQPPVEREVPETDMSLMGAALIGAGQFPTAAQPPITSPVVAPPVSDAVAHGEYLTHTGGCRDCHGADLGGVEPGGQGPSGPNLTTEVPAWSEEEFVTLMRTGVTPDGEQLNPDEMPWDEFNAAYTDEELGALYAYLDTLAPIP